MAAPEVEDQHDGVVFRASTSQSVDLGFLSQVKLHQKILKNVFTAFLLGAQHKMNSVENKPASFFVVSQGKTLMGCLYLYTTGRWRD